MAGNSNWKGWHTLGLVVIILAVTLLGLLIPSQHRLWSWLGTLILLALFAVIAGHGVTGLWRGVLIDERNKMSLSRLQMILWTIIVLSGFFTAALSNLATGQANPLSIAVPGQLWLLMGISTTSLVGSPLILSTKTTKPADTRERERTLELMSDQGVDAATVETKGQVVVNTRPEYAKLADLFKGEETGNAAQLDLGKIQMLYFTLILVLAYAAALGTAFAVGGKGISALPALDSGMAALLGISHAGYLTNKAIPHSETG